MADINCNHSAELIRSDIFDAATEVEEVSCLLNSYSDLLLKANEFLIDDPQSCKRANLQIYALLEAVRPQLDRLKAIPDRLIVVSGALKEMAAV
ncbi:MAG: hypothetical protein IPM03_17080 [Sulfuritalea sp.]|nr:hypothetical protein [Sulfuritalea sp.]